jgi:hypothetical protein
MKSCTSIITDLRNKEEWNYYRDQLPDHIRDIYSSPDYYLLWEKKDFSTAKCFIYQKDNNLALYPFLLCRIEESFLPPHSKYYDIQGAYGYNGVFSSTSDASFIAGFFQSFDDYCRESSIIAEFTRFNPVLKNHNFHFNHSVRKVNRNIIVDLSQEDIWMDSFEHSTRKNVKKAIRSGLEVLSFTGDKMPEEKYTQFHSIYIQTMQRNFAEEEFYFKPEFFITAGNSLGSGAEFYFTMYKNEVVSAELIVKNDYCAYSFLGGTNQKFYPLRPNDLLKHEIIHNLKRQGLNFYCIGGGKTENDGIFRFKKTFAKNGEVDFFVGKKIHNTEIYDLVIKNWDESHPEKKDEYKDFFLRYRIN